ncbi:MAG: nickel pincer cofactor biosynthesis protein LarC [Synergistaceae bacterium]|jgi:uncharacterized protein (TIGR00299 family) protein|nr:nickel pincer cofactor biosynthesis protein LarC [Synergistaceae bacterium]
MKTLYFDCFAGISGDMTVGALFELVPDAAMFRGVLAGLRRLPPSEYEISLGKDVRHGLVGTRFVVQTGEHHPHRSLRDVEEIVMDSSLSDRVKTEVARAFARLAEAEARVHGTTPDKIHFHEVGAVDSIIDIVGTYVLIEALGWPRVLCSPINVGSGTVECAHGVLPVPAPATEVLLHGLPVFSRGEPMERTTPTGALLARSLASAFTSIPDGVIASAGHGIGARESDIPNILRVLLMDAKEASGGFERDAVSLLESNIDDMNPQDFELAAERLFEAGALDVWLEHVSMKKGRPGVKLCCLCRPEQADFLSVCMLCNTTTQGVRRLAADRAKLRHTVEERDTSFGKIRFKSAYLGESVLRRTPEYDDLKRAALERGVPLAEVRHAASQE